MMDDVAKRAAGLILAVTAFWIVYLIGAFAAASFDITQWDVAVRIMVAILGGCAGFAAYVTYVEEYRP
jgi:hypothetical protein